MTDFSTLARGQRVAGLLLGMLPGFYNLSPKMFRWVFALLDRVCGLNLIPIQRVEDFRIPVGFPSGHINLRLYQARNAHHKTLVYFHSGGCVIGSIQTHDRFCRYLAHYGQCSVISVDYRLAPEYKFPIPITDAIQAWNWVLANAERLKVNTDHIGAGGDSGGGYLALLLSLMEEQQSLLVQATQRPQFQLLLFPVLDQRGETKSYGEFTHHLILTQQIMRYFTAHFLNHLDEVHQPLASPLLSEHLAKCPKTYLLTVEYDPLRDEGLVLAKTLAEQGVALTHQHFGDCMHAFFSAARFSPRAKQRVLHICEELKRL